MDLLDRNTLDRLLEDAASPCASFYLASARTQADNQRDPIRFKNMVRDAAERLAAHGLRTPDVEALLDPAHRLLQNSLFWQQLGPSFVFFTWPGGSRWFATPHVADELLVVADRPHLAPLILQLDGGGHFYVLGLAQKRQVRFYRGDRLGLEEIEVPGLPPGDVSEALMIDEPEQLHAPARSPGIGGPRSPGVAGHRGPNMHAHGGDADERKDWIRHYFRLVDQALRRERLRDEKAPLVLAGVEYLLPLYHEASTYGNIAGDGVKGNPEGFRPDELWQRAWPLVEPLLAQPREAALDRFREHHGAATGLASTDMAEIVPAAHYGRVDSLFVAPGTEAWGRFDPATGEVHLNGGPAPGAVELCDAAVRETYLRGGSVFPLADGQLETRVAATFRF